MRMTIVLDCNVIVMCLTSRSPYHAIYQSLINGKYSLAVNTDIVLEYEEIIQQKYGTATANAFITLLKELPNVLYVNSSYKWQLIKIDPDDNKYCDCAIAGKASFLVTEDKHFDILKSVPFPKLTPISIKYFLEVLKGGQDSN